MCSMQHKSQLLLPAQRHLKHPGPGMSFPVGFTILLLSCSTYAASFQLANLSHGAAHLSGLKMVLEEQDAMEMPSRKVLQATSKDRQLIGAVRRSDYDEVQELLNEGADPNYVYKGSKKERSALRAAIDGDDGQMVTLLIQGGADPRGPGGSLLRGIGPLQFAAFNDAPSALAALLDAGIPIDGLNVDGGSALHAAAVNGATRAAAVLLDSGASIDIASTEDDGTPLVYAIQYTHLSMVVLLLSRGADVDGRYGRGLTPLHKAAQVNSGIIIQELLDNGSSIDALDDENATPLFYAAFLGNEEAIEVLVLRGADKSIEGYNLTPIEAVCWCITGSLEACNIEACDDPLSMQQLLL